jgi:hypothetical protein
MEDKDKPGPSKTTIAKRPVSRKKTKESLPRPPSSTSSSTSDSENKSITDQLYKAMAMLADEKIVSSNVVSNLQNIKEVLIRSKLDRSTVATLQAIIEYLKEEEKKELATIDNNNQSKNQSIPDYIQRLEQKIYLMEKRTEKLISTTRDELRDLKKTIEQSQKQTQISL